MCDSSAALPRRFISNCDLVQGVPPALRSQAARIIGGKTALLARIDAASGDPTGEDIDCATYNSIRSFLTSCFLHDLHTADVLQRRAAQQKLPPHVHSSAPNAQGA